MKSQNLQCFRQECLATIASIIPAASNCDINKKEKLVGILEQIHSVCHGFGKDRSIRPRSLIFWNHKYSKISFYSLRIFSHEILFPIYFLLSEVSELVNTYQHLIFPESSFIDLVQLCSENCISREKKRFLINQV